MSAKSTSSLHNPGSNRLGDWAELWNRSGTEALTITSHGLLPDARATLAELDHCLHAARSEFEESAAALGRALLESQPFTKIEHEQCAAPYGTASHALLAHLLGNGDDRVAHLALMGLTLQGDNALPGIHHIAAHIGSGNFQLREQVLFTLRNFGPDAAPATPAICQRLLETWDYTEKIELCETLGAIGPRASAAVPPLIGLLDEDPIDEGCIKVCSAVVQALGYIGPAARDAVPRLVRLLSDGPVGAPFQAAVALGRIGDNSPEVLAGLQTFIAENERWSDHATDVGRRALAILRGES